MFSIYVKDLYIWKFHISIPTYIGALRTASVLADEKKERNVFIVTPRGEII